MNEPTNDNDIDALLAFLGRMAMPKQHAALAALVAERDALKEENNALRSRQKSHQDEVLDRMFEMDALRKRVAELEAHPPAASDLRERDETLIRWMNQVTAMLCHSMTHGHDTKQELVTRCDKAIDAMRKGEQNAE